MPARTCWARLGGGGGAADDGDDVDGGAVPVSVGVA
jgi:hypothetical protein